MNKKICLVCSLGGHLNQIMELSEFYKEYDYYFITFYRNSASNFKNQEKVYFVKDPSRNIFNFAINFYQSLLLFFKENPDIIISTGAGVAIATCYLGWLFRKKIVFIEDWCVIDKPSLSGRLVYPISNLFFVQWEELLKHYSKAIYKGSLV